MVFLNLIHRLYPFKMNDFINSARKVYETLMVNPTYYESLTVVLGNESCDLDSAVSALVYAFFLHHERIENHLSKTAVLPLLNIDHDDFQLKTEVDFFLRANDISLDFVPTRGSRSSDFLGLEKIHETGRLKLVLVDHHTLPPTDFILRSAVTEVIDHRPRDPDWPWGDAKVTIEPVGSCATLVAKKMIDQNSYLLTPEIVKLLLGPIILDTANLSPEAGRATPLDFEVLETLEKTITVDRKQQFEELVDARSNVSTLSVSQILRKDLKAFAGVPVAGAPILLEDLSRREDFKSAVDTFMKIRNVPAMVLMGAFIQGDSMQRDIAVAWRDSDPGEKLVQVLLDSSNPFLQLEEVLDRDFQQMRLFQQGNIKATRKHISPIILKVGSEVPDIVLNGA